MLLAFSFNFSQVVKTFWFVFVLILAPSVWELSLDVCVWCEWGRGADWAAALSFVGFFFKVL